MMKVWENVKYGLPIEGVRIIDAHGHCGDYKIEFSVCPPKYGITSVETEEFISGSSSQVSIEISNLTALDKTGIILVGIYEGNKLLTVKTSNVAVDAQSVETVDINLTIPESYDNDIHTLRVYLMNSSNYFKLDSVIK